MHTWYGWCGMAFDDLRTEPLFPFKAHESHAGSNKLYGYSSVSKTINKHVPLRSISNRKQKFLAKPWLTAGLRKSIRVKNNLFYTSDRDKYKFYRNKIIYLTRLSKANYYQSFFDLNICNMRQTWKGINELIGNGKKKNKRNSINSIRPNPNEVRAVFSSITRTLLIQLTMRFC